MSRFFFLRPGALGDLLLCAPLMAALRARLPGVHLTLAGHYGATRLLHGAGLVDVALSQDDLRLSSLFSREADASGLAAVLGQVDVAVAWLADPEGLVAANLRRLAIGPVVVAPSQPPPDRARHVAEHLFDTAAPLGCRPAEVPAGPLLVAPAEEGGWAADLLDAAAPDRLPAVALHPGSGSRRKNWSAAGFAAVADALAGERAVVLICGPADEEATAGVLAHARSRPTVVREPSLPRVAALLARCGAFLGNDSGIAHLAALLGVPTVVLFGPTYPARWRPYGDKVTVLSWAGGAEALPSERVAATIAAACAL